MSDAPASRQYPLLWPELDAPPSIPATNDSKLTISTNIISPSSSNRADYLLSVVSYELDGFAVLADLIGFSTYFYNDSYEFNTNLFRAFQFVGQDQEFIVNKTLQASSPGGFACVFNTVADLSTQYSGVDAQAGNYSLTTGNLSLACISPDTFAIVSYSLSNVNLTLGGFRGQYQGM